MARRVSAADVRLPRGHTIEEISEAVSVTPQTVRAWIRQGRPATRRPYLILGPEMKDSLARADVNRTARDEG